MMEYEYDLLEELERKLHTTLKESPIKFDVGIKNKDSSFKELFEVKAQFIELIRTFIKEEWVREINEENIELTTNEFVMWNAHKRTSDLIYKVKIAENELYFFLLELQSSIDNKMPYRLLEYMFEIWRRFEKENKLLIIIPCVVYTGKSKWNVGDFRSLFNEDERFTKYIPNFEYILIDVNRYSDEELLNIANLISSVFFLNKTKGGEESIKRLKTVVENVSKIRKEQQKAFVKWSETMFCKDDKVYNYFEENIKKEEEKMAFADYVPEMFEILKKQGEVRGKTGMIRRLLIKKLKCEPSEKISKLIEEASEDKLEKIEDKIFEINSWKEVEEILS